MLLNCFTLNKKIQENNKYVKMKKINNSSFMESIKSKDPSYKTFISFLKESVSSFHDTPTSDFEAMVGPKRHLEIYKSYLLEVCNQNVDVVLNIESLNLAIDNYVNRPIDLNSSEDGFFILVPVKINPADKSSNPRLTICFVNYEASRVISGEAHGTRLMRMIPSEFKQHAYGLHFTKSTQGEALNLADNLLIQLNYYRDLFGLQPSSF